MLLGAINDYWADGGIKRKFMDERMIDLAAGIKA
ncbi:MAG: hypothetical protein ACI9E1_001356 [Cryomorphaceae bacterium]|jgi:hypothetical protein